MKKTDRLDFLEKSFTEINEKLDALLTIFTAPSPLYGPGSREVTDYINKNDVELTNGFDTFIFKDSLFVENKLYAYDEMLQSIIKGKDNRILLLRDGYEFSNKHTKNEVFQYIAVGQEDEGYPIELMGNENNIGFKQGAIVGLTGIFYGAVCFNEAGLIFYYSLNNGIKVHSGNTLTLVCNNRGIWDEYERD